MKIAMLGFGSVGKGVYQACLDHQMFYASQYGVELEVEKVLVRRPHPMLGERGVTTFEAIVDDPEIECVIEVMGGIQPAYSYISRALKAGKHVVSANKDLVAEKGPELFEIARNHRVKFCFEASVGGGIPVLYPLKSSLQANRIESLSGILNGTSNYILSRMQDDRLAFDEALAQAQDLGYAERDPSADISGLDAARKLVILASLAWNKQFSLHHVRCQGIETVRLDDLAEAKQQGETIKLVAEAMQASDGYRLSVGPKRISSDHPLFMVSGVNNAVVVKGDLTGDVMFFGAGAGGQPTASSVLSDVLNLALNQAVQLTFSNEVPSVIGL